MHLTAIKSSVDCVLGISRGFRQRGGKWERKAGRRARTPPTGWRTEAVFLRGAGGRPGARGQLPPTRAPATRESAPRVLAPRGRGSTGPLRGPQPFEIGRHEYFAGGDVRLQRITLRRIRPEIVIVLV